METGIGIDFGTKTVLIFGKEMIDQLTRDIDKPLTPEICQTMAETIVRVKHPEYVDDGEAIWQLGTVEETLPYLMSMMSSDMEVSSYKTGAT